MSALPPRLLDVPEAAAYCGFGGHMSFTQNCPVRRRRIRPGMKGLRYDVRDLDAWIDTLPYEDGSEIAINNPNSAEYWLSKLNGTDQTHQRREGVRQQRQDLRISPSHRETA